MNQFNVTVFTGSAYQVEKRNVVRDTLLTLPEGTLLLGSEFVVDEDGAEGLELWLAVPHEATLTTATHTDRLEPAVLVSSEGLGDEIEDLGFVDEGVEEDSEYYTDY